MSSEREIGLQALQQGDLNQAITYLEAACRQDASDYQSHFYLGAAYVQAKRMEDAIPILTRAVQLQPKDAVAREHLGQSLEKVGWKREALEALHDVHGSSGDTGKAREEAHRLVKALPAMVPLPPGSSGSSAQGQSSTGGSSPFASLSQPTQGSDFDLPAQPSYRPPSQNPNAPPGYGQQSQYGQQQSQQQGYGQQAGYAQQTPMQQNSYAQPVPGQGYYPPQSGPQNGYAPPQGYNAPGYAPSQPNTSGTRSSVPPEVARGWNWGAAFVPIWSIPHRLYLIFAVNVLFLIINYIPDSLFGKSATATVGIVLVLGIICMIVVMGLRGNTMAWRWRRFDSVEHFHTVQRAWMPAGIVFCVLMSLFFLFAIMVGFVQGLSGIK